MYQHVQDRRHVRLIVGLTSSTGTRACSYLANILLCGVRWHGVVGRRQEGLKHPLWDLEEQAEPAGETRGLCSRLCPEHSPQNKGGWWLGDGFQSVRCPDTLKGNLLP